MPVGAEGCDRQFARLPVQDAGYQPPPRNGDCLEARVKYITYDDYQFGPVIVCFSGQLAHADVARRMGIREVRSAGFIARSQDGMFCHGSSETLGVGSLVSDSKLATAFFK